MLTVLLWLHFQALPDVIDLCSTTTTESSGEDEIKMFSPVKSDPADAEKQIQ